MSILTHLLHLPSTLLAKLRRHRERKAQARKWRDQRHRESRRARKDEADMSDAEFKREWARLRKGEREAEMKDGEIEGKGGTDDGATGDDDEKRGWEGKGEAEEERGGRAGAKIENEGVLKHKREIGKEYLALGTFFFFFPLTPSPASPFSFGLGNAKSVTHESLLTLMLRAGVHPESRRCLVRCRKEGGRR